jgi:LysM repeat protein
MTFFYNKTEEYMSSNSIGSNFNSYDSSFNHNDNGKPDARKNSNYSPHHQKSTQFFVDFYQGSSHATRELDEPANSDPGLTLRSFAKKDEHVLDQRVNQELNTSKIKDSSRNEYHEDGRPKVTFNESGRMTIHIYHDSSTPIGEQDTVGRGRHDRSYPARGGGGHSRGTSSNSSSNEGESGAGSSNNSSLPSSHDRYLAEQELRRQEQDQQRQANLDRAQAEHDQMLSNFSAQWAWETSLVDGTLASLSEQDKITLEAMKQYPELKFNIHVKDGDVHLRLGDITFISPLNTDTHGASLVPFNSLTEFFNPSLVIPENSQIIPAPGETLTELAENSFTTVERLLELNPNIMDANSLEPNVRINLPAGAVASQSLSDRVITSSNLGGLNQLGYTKIAFHADQQKLWLEDVFKDFSPKELSELILGFNPGISSLDQIKEGDHIVMPAVMFSHLPPSSPLLGSAIDPPTDGSTSIGSISAERVEFLNNRIRDLRGPSLSSEELADIKYIDSNLIHKAWSVSPGTKLEVQEGDTLSSLAKEFGVSESEVLEVLREHNPQIQDLGQIKAGDQIYLPSDALAKLPDSSSVFDNVVDPKTDGSEAIGNLSPDRVAELNARLDDVDGPPLTPTELAEIHHISRHLNHDRSKRWVAETGAKLTIEPGYNLELLANEFGVTHEVALQSVLDYNPHLSGLDQIKVGDSINIPLAAASNLSESSIIRSDVDSILDRVDLAQAEISAWAEDAGYRIEDSLYQTTGALLSGVGSVQRSDFVQSLGIADIKELSVDFSDEYFKQSTGGLSIEESQKLFFGQTGNEISRETIEILFTDPVKSREILMNDPEIHKQYRDILNHYCPVK